MLSALQNVLSVYGNSSVINLHNVFFSLLVLLFSVASYAQTEEEKNIIPVSGAESLTQSHNMASRIVADKVTKNGSPVTNLSQVFLGLLFVIGLIFAMAWVLKRVSQGSFSGAQYIKLISSVTSSINLPGDLRLFIVLCSIEIRRNDRLSAAQ